MEKTSRKRTFKGCKTCRNRHLKCDEARPSCGPCKRGGLQCGGYWSPLLWINEGPSTRSRGQQAFEFRYPVLSESQRQQMSSEISRSLDRKSAVDLLERLDASCYRLESRGQPIQGLTRGPFGAFSSNADHSDAEHSPRQVLEAEACETSQREHQSVPDTNSVGVEKASACLDDYSSMGAPEPAALFHSADSATDLHDWFTTVEDSVFDPFLSPGLVSFENSLSAPMGDSLTELPTDEPEVIVVDPQPTPNPGWQNDRHARLSIVAPDLTRTNVTILPSHSEPLLRHYRQQIYEGSLHQAKRASPWQSIFFPCALETFAELSLWRNTTQTRYALLHALLALSAFHRRSQNDIGSGGKSWHEVGCWYQRKAQCHLRSALATEMTGIKQEKYKELLMAILAVSMISLSRGGGSFEIFLLDAERLIYRQGLGEDIPMDARLLHHMYSCLRVMSESVGARLQSPTDDPTREYNEPPTKNGRFCLATECYDIGLDADEVKVPDIAYTDIHLQIQGQWNKSLFPVVYGFPELLWTLLSQSVATAREKARIESLDPPDLGLTNALRHHIENLEKTIWSWTPTAHLIGPQVPQDMSSEKTQDLLDNPEARPLAQGLHQAIIIYFYRRVAKVSRMVIQSIVEKAFSYLEPCIARINDQDLTPCIAWAIVTTASEAASPELQVRALRILDLIEDQGLSVANMPSKNALAAMWQQRDILVGY